MEAIRFGVLGAARIAPRALIHPARDIPGVTVEVVAARDAARAEAFAREHGVARGSGSYRAVIEDPSVDAVYVALPNSLHAHWAGAALAAGKHVLVEKPAAASGAEARPMFEAARAASRLCVEAMHYIHHPLPRKALELVRGGCVGTLTHVEAGFTAPLRRPGDIRYDAELAGGALRDLGCYPLHWVRQLAVALPVVRDVRADWMAPGVDRAMEVTLDAGGWSARVAFAFVRAPWMRQWCVVHGTAGTLRLNTLFSAGWFGSMRLSGPSGERVWRAERRPSFAFQLEAFLAAARGEQPACPSAEDTLANLALMDAVRERSATARGSPLTRPLPASAA